MPKHLMRLFILFLLAMALPSAAQEMITSSNQSGYLFDHPAEWNIYDDEDFPAVVYFDDGAMFGLISILESRLVGDDPEEVLEDVLDEIPRADRENGDFEEPFDEYQIEEWEVVRATRVRRNDRFLEYFFMASANDISVFVRARFRRGGETTYLPIFDTMIASVRAEEDEPEEVVTEEAQAPTVNACMNTASSDISFDNLTANYVYEDGSYQFNYPDEWEVSPNADGSIRFINREGATLFGTITLQAAGENNPEAALSAVLAGQEGYSAIETFSLNGLSIARSYRDNTRGGTKDLAMAALRGDLIVIMLASSNSQDFPSYEPTLQAVFFSFRLNGRDIEINLSTSGVRQGLSSAHIYGQVVCSDTVATVAETEAPRPQSAIALESSYTSEDGRFRLSYPEGWTQDFDRGYVILSNRETYDLYNPTGGEVQMTIFFIEHIENLNVDEFSPASILEFAILNDANFEYWTEPTEFSSLERRAAYADFESSFTEWVMRSYFLELDAEALIYTRLDMIANETELEGFHDFALAILETIEIVE